MSANISSAPRHKIASRPHLSAAGLGPAEFSRLLLLVHRIAAEPQSVRQMLDAVIEIMDARHASLGICDSTGQRLHFLQSRPYRADQVQDYESAWGRHDPLRCAVLAAEPGRFLCKNVLVPSAVQREHPYFRDWCAAQGFEHLFIAHLPLDNDQHCVVACMRSADQPRMSPKEIAFMDSLLPHLRHALVLGRHAERLQVFSDIGQNRLQHAGQGVLVLDGEGRVAFMNSVGSGMLQDARIFRSPVGRLALVDAAKAARFEDLLRQCIALSSSRSILGGGALAVPRERLAPLVVSVLPYRHMDVLSTHVSALARAIVTLFEPAAPLADSRKSLCEFYGLTPTEADVCWRLGNGDSVERIAQEAGISRETVRSQLKRVFAKTGTHRQSDLVRLVLAGPVAWVSGALRGVTPVISAFHAGGLSLECALRFPLA